MSPKGRTTPLRGRRRAALAGLVLAVLAVHWWISEELSARLAMLADGSPSIERLETVYARTLQPAEPAAVAPPPPAPAPPRPAKPRVAQPAAAASEPESPVAEAATEVPESPDDAHAGAPETSEPQSPFPGGAAPPVLADAPMPERLGPDNATETPAPFEWPPSTRIGYKLFGNYRGEVHGSAQVEWIRVDERYQVHIDVAVGPSFAPLMKRRMSSDGRITPQGLAPEIYDEETRVAFRTRRAGVHFGTERITLNNGREVPALPGVQDTASQFVQLTYRLTLQPELLTPGQAIEFPLALPRRQDRWYYDVVGEETLKTPFGNVDAFHLRPRRETKRRDELTADVWFAPALLNLPVRILIRQDEENYIDLMITKLPELEGSPPSATTPGTRP